MGEYYSEEASQMLSESLSQMNASLNHLVNTINMLGKAIIEKNSFGKDEFFIAERDFEGLRDALVEMKRLGDRKRKVLIIK